MTHNYVGGNYPIHDALAKVKGTAKYVGDLVFPRMYYAKIAHSTVAHGDILRMDTRAAEQADQVIGVFNYMNTPQIPYNQYRIYREKGTCPEDQRLLGKTMKYFGDFAAVVVAKTEAAAEKALSLIDVEYTILPVVTETGEARKQQSHVVGNYQYAHPAEHVPNEPLIDSTTRVQTQRMHHAALENHTCIAQWDDTGILTIWTPCQGVYAVRTVVADLLGLSYNKVRVIKTRSGGSFGGKQEAVLEPLTAFLAMKTKGTVLLRFDRKETILSTTVRPAMEHRFLSACTPSGKIHRLAIETLMDAGAYTTSSHDYIGGNMGKITKLYQLPQFTYQAKAVLTNTPTAGGMRGWGAPEFFAGVEIHLDLTAKRLGLDPVAFRIKNLIQPGQVDPISKISVGNARIRECLEEGAKAFGWDEKRRRKETLGRYRYGTGVACGVIKNGMYGNFPEMSTMVLKMNEDGSFILNTAVHDMGCGTLQSLKIIVAEVLDVSPEEVTVLEADTQCSPYDYGTYGSRVTYICGACAHDAALAMKAKIIQIAGTLLGKEQECLTLAGGTVIDKTDKAYISLAEVGTMARTQCLIDPVVTHTLQATSNPGAYAAHFAEVCVDTYTGLIQTIDYLAVHDVGKAINRSMVEGQIHGGVQMGLGYALTEEVKIRLSGEPETTGFHNYKVINAPQVPDIRVLLLEEQGDKGPFGAKSIGEIATVPVAPAIVNAVNHALGTELSHLPLVPEKIIAKIKER